MKAYLPDGTVRIGYTPEVGADPAPQGQTPQQGVWTIVNAPENTRGEAETGKASPCMARIPVRRFAPRLLEPSRDRDTATVPTADGRRGRRAEDRERPTDDLTLGGRSHARVPGTAAALPTPPCPSYRCRSGDTKKKTGQEDANPFGHYLHAASHTTHQAVGRGGNALDRLALVADLLDVHPGS